MKANKGFIVLETAAMFLIIGVLLTGVFKVFGSGVGLMQRNNELQLAAQLCQERMAGAELSNLPQGWRIEESYRQNGGVNLREIQVLKADKVIFNLIWAQHET